MSGKWLRTVVLAGVTTTWSHVLADDGVHIVIPMPSPAARPSDADVTAVNDARGLVIIEQRVAADAHAELAKAQADLKRHARELQERLETSQDMVTARAEVSSAKASYDAAAKPVLVTLGRRADYREACDALSRAQQASAEVSARADATFQDRFAAGQAVLNARTAVSRLENDALAGDPQVVRAWSECTAAAARLREVRLEFEQTMREDPSYVAARQMVQDTQEKVTAADEELAAARQDLAAARQRLADRQAARQNVVDWAKSHGLPEPP